MSCLTLNQHGNQKVHVVTDVTTPTIAKKVEALFIGLPEIVNGVCIAQRTQGHTKYCCAWGYECPYNRRFKIYMQDKTFGGMWQCEKL